MADSTQKRPLGDFLSHPTCSTKQFIHMKLLNASDEFKQCNDGARNNTGDVPAFEGRVLNQRLPDILSSSDIYTLNPQLLFGMTNATDFLRTVPGVNVPRAGTLTHSRWWVGQ